VAPESLDIVVRSSAWEGKPKVGEGFKILLNQCRHPLGKRGLREGMDANHFFKWLVKELVPKGRAKKHSIIYQCRQGRRKIRTIKRRRSGRDNCRGASDSLTEIRPTRSDGKGGHKRNGRRILRQGTTRKKGKAATTQTS